MTKKKNIIQKTPDKTIGSANPESFQSPLKWAKWIILLFGFLLYANTLNHDYTQDDAIVIYDNMFTQKGIAGIPGLLTKDTFYGFFKEEGKANLVSGGRYRPFTPIMFAIETQICSLLNIKKHQYVGHFINALLYGILGIFIFNLLCLMFQYRNDFKEKFIWILFTCVLLYMSHPVHTEAVANIKGRDEIMAMMGAVLASYFICKNAVSQSSKYSLYAFIAMFIGLMSKENTITFLAVIPAILIFFFNKKTSEAIKHLMPVIIASALFLFIRALVFYFTQNIDNVASIKSNAQLELMNNPFIKLDGNKYVDFSLGEKLGTIFHTLFNYIKLLFYPHPLTHDYYPRHIEITNFFDLKSLLGIGSYALMTITAIYYYKKDRLISFIILFFIATISIVSNVVFPIGTNMSERFLFMPSLAFCLFIPYMIYKLIPNGKTVLAICSVIIGLYSMKTFMRNQVWKDDFTLFTTDVKTSSNSAKMLNAAGGALSTEASKEKDEMKKKKMLEEAIVYLEKCVKIHPTYKNPYLLMGNSHFFLGNYDKSIEAYQKCLKLDPNFKDAINNMAVAYRDAGRKAGEKENNLPKAEALLLKSLEVNPNDTETLRLMGITYGIAGQHTKAITFFERVIKLEPKNAAAYLNISSAYNYAGDVTNAAKYRQIALQLDPEIDKKK